MKKLTIYVHVKTFSISNVGIVILQGSKRCHVKYDSQQNQKDHNYEFLLFCNNYGVYYKIVLLIAMFGIIRTKNLKIIFHNGYK